MSKPEVTIGDRNRMHDFVDRRFFRGRHPCRGEGPNRKAQRRMGQRAIGFAS